MKDELLRVPGVSDVAYLGLRDYSIRAWLDPQKLASKNMTAMEVADAVRSQNQAAAPGQTGSILFDLDTTPTQPDGSYELTLDFVPGTYTIRDEKRGKHDAYRLVVASYPAPDGKARKDH